MKKLNNNSTSALLKQLWQIIKAVLSKYFNIMPDKENEQDTIRIISEGVSFRGANLWVLVFAIFIASLGLNVNSTAVIIGAMLISPLMGPIIGMGLSVGINDYELLKRSVKNYLVATLISVITATVYFLLTPLDEAQSELLARTSPTLYDVLIALFGGAAGIVALSTKGKGNVLPGVAIATALMPPLCTAGFGLATGNFFYFIGAFYLFFINTVFISLATYLGVRLMKFKEKTFVDAERYATVKRSIIFIVVATMIPAGIMTFIIVRNSIFKSNVGSFVHEQLENKGTRIISYDYNRDSLWIRVVAVGKELSDTSIKDAEKQMEHYSIGNYRLQVIQGSQSDSVMLLNNKLLSMRSNADNYTTLLREESEKKSRLQAELQQYTRFESLTPAVAKEMKALYPAVSKVILSVANEAIADSTSSRHYVLAVVSTKRRAAFNEQERTKISQWLGARLQADSLVVIIQ